MTEQTQENQQKVSSTESMPLMKTLEQSRLLNNFMTNCQFTKELGVELIKGSATDEHLVVLNESMAGIGEFIDLLKEKMQEKKSQ